MVTRSLCGSEAFTRRFRNLSTLFAGHLRGMASTNPLKWPVWTLLRANYGSLISASWITHRLLANPDLAAMDDRIRLRAQRMRKPPPSTLSDWKKACRSLQRKDCASDLVTGPRSASVNGPGGRPDPASQQGSGYHLAIHDRDSGDDSSDQGSTGSALPVHPTPGNLQCALIYRRPRIPGLPATQCDRWLRWPNPAVRQMAVWWRLGIFGSPGTPPTDHLGPTFRPLQCSDCGSPLRPLCVAQCDLLRSWRAEHVTGASGRVIDRSFAKLQDRLAQLGHDRDDCSLVDLFLNLDRPDWFVGALQGLLGEDVYERIVAHMRSRL